MEDLNLSIHPRNWDGGNKVKSNTAKPPKRQDRGKLGVKLARLNRRRLERAELVRMSKAKSAEVAFRMPGSMNQHKR